MSAESKACLVRFVAQFSIHQDENSRPMVLKQSNKKKVIPVTLRELW